MPGWHYAFDHPHQLDRERARALLGGKGAGLAEMTALGLAVPPGFTIPTTACRIYLEQGWSDELTDAVRAGLAGLEESVGRRLGDPANPLLVSVRSGAAQSMPGMMDSVLNVGMTEETARGLAILTGDPGFAWDTYRRAVTGFAVIVGGADPDVLQRLQADTKGPDGPTEAVARAFADAVADAGHPLPPPVDQVRAATETVFRSWNSERAVTYRDREGITHDGGTAVTVQAMVFGNMGTRSGTGVAFSRDPSSGEPGLMGDFLTGAQGEDVVAGTHRTKPLVELANTWPDLWDELNQTATTLEHHGADMVDLEFTVEDGKLWLLQTRAAKRSPAAVFRTAVDMAEDPDFPVDRAEAVRRCRPHLDNPPRLPGPPTDDDDVVVATGLAASPGRAAGVASFDPDDAMDREQAGERVVLIRAETSPADVHGMAASVGLVTTLGGLVSHAAVVARSWGLPAVVGCGDVTLTGDAMVVAGRRVEAGAVLTVCGDSGRVLLGDRPADGPPLPQVDIIRGWARAIDDPTDSAGGTAGDTAAVTADDVLRLIALKGMGSAESLVEPSGASAQTLDSLVAELAQQGLVAELNGGRYRATPEGQAWAQELYASETGAQPVCEAALDDFHRPNLLLKEVVTAWQVKPVDGQDVPNDHGDPDYDTAVLDRLRDDVHPAVVPIIDTVATALPRLARYQDRLAASLQQLADGDHRYVAHPLLDSYHTVWFELHEELIRLAGRDRKTETEAGRA